MALIFGNNSVALLGQFMAIGSAQLVLELGEGVRFPTIAAGDTFLITVQQSAAIEIMRVTARVSDTLTVLRGQEGTAIQSWTPGASVDMRVTAGTLAAMMQTEVLLGNYNAYQTIELVTLNVDYQVNLTDTFQVLGTVALPQFTQKGVLQTVHQISCVPTDDGEAVFEARIIRPGPIVDYTLTLTKATFQGASARHQTIPGLTSFAFPAPLVASQTLQILQKRTVLGAGGATCTHNFSKAVMTCYKVNN